MEKSTDSSQISSPGAIVSLLAAVTTLFIAGLLLFAWIAEVQWLEQWGDGALSMQASVAVAFLTGGVVLIVSRWRIRPTTIALRSLLCIAMLLLVFAFEAPLTAIGIVLLTLAILIDMVRNRAGRFASRSLAVVVQLLALAALLGYAYGAPLLYLGIDGLVGTTLPGAVLMFVLGAGIIWLQPQYGFPAMLTENSIVGTHVRSLLPIVVAAPLLAGAAVVAGYGQLYEGHFAVALTSLVSLVAAGLIAAISVVLLRRSDEALYIRDRALAAATTGILITDHRQREEPIMFANPAFTEMTGYAADEAIGQNCRFLNREVENDPAVLQSIRACIRDETDGHFELRNRRKDGQVFWNRLSLAPIANFTGEVTHFVGIVEDITESRDYNIRLQEALDSAHSASTMRDTFVRLASHELRTPLNAALTWIRLMEVDDNDAIREKGLQIVAESIQSQSRLIDDLSDVSRVASHGVRLEAAKADARSLIEETVEELRPAIEAQLSLHVEVEPGDYAATVDSLRLKQIVRNLLTNAHRYTDDGGAVTVKLSVSADSFVLTVTDTGKGLTAEEAARIFEPFWRVDSNLPGLGVGLTIVAALVAAHDGVIDVSSDGLGKGSTFIVQLPLNATPEAHGPVLMQ